MSGVAGRSGPPGNNNGGKAKRWEAALERAFAAWPEPPDCSDCTPLMRGLNMAAHGFVGEVMEKKDIAFYRETADRLDGKAHQSIDADLRGQFSVIATPLDEKL